MGDLRQNRPSNTEIQPPKWAVRFFRWYCNEELQEELLGDFYEQFCERIEKEGPTKAKIGYWLNVFTFINKYTLRRKGRSYTHTITPYMLRNYFKIGLRNILKNKLSSLINILGLALAVGCCLVVYRFVIQFYYPDAFHDKLDRLFVAERLVNEDGDRQLWGPIPEPLGPAMKNTIPQVVDFCRYEYGSANFKRGEQVFNEWITFVDDSFYSLFDFPVKWGNESNFTRRNAVVLSERAAEKYFGQTNPVGQEVDLYFHHNGEEKEASFVVQGVMEKIPQGASFDFNILLPFDTQRDIFSQSFNDWSRHNTTLFLELSSSEQVAAVTQQVRPILDQYNEANAGWATEELHLQPLSGMFRHSYEVNDSPFISAHIVGLYMLLFIAIALLTLACFNYMNIAVASAAKRLREIGVRKVMGGNRRQLIIQFLSENLVICLISVLTGLLLAITLFQPWFNQMSGLELDISFQKVPSLWIFLVVLTLVTTIGAAGYPAFYLASFKPIAVLQNKIQFGSKNRFRKVLLGIQFLLSFLAIFSVVMFLQATKDAYSKPWGYAHKGLLDIRLNYGEDFATLKNEIQQLSGVQGVAGARHNAGGSAEKLVARVEGQNYNVAGLSVGYDYIETLQFDLLEGRSFDRNRPADRQQSIVINERFERRMGWEESLGKTIELDSQSYLVIGKVRDFHHEPFDSQIKPMVIRLTEPDQFRHILVRAEEKQLAGLMDALRVSWKKHYPATPFAYQYQDDTFRSYFDGFTQVNSVFKATALLTIIISSVGLFGLAMLILSRKMKELSIRKVLGASMVDISYQINKEFLTTILIATLLGVPAGYFLLNTIFSMFFPEARIGILPFLLTFLFLVVMTLLSVSRHIYVAMTSNPSRYLKDE